MTNIGDDLHPAPIMNFYAKTIALLFALTLAQSTLAQEKIVRQETAALRQTVEQFLKVQSAGLPGTVSITVGAVDPRLNLAACPAPEAFLPANARVWGKTTVGVRCSAPATWTVYIPATVRVQGDYIAAAAPLVQGQSITATNITRQKGDLTTLPAGVITDESQAVGRTLTISLTAGTPLRQDTLRNQQAVQQGQVIRLITNGPGFKVSTEGRALNNAYEGQVTQARAANGQIVSGVAKMGGIVEVTY